MGPAGAHQPHRHVLRLEGEDVPLQYRMLEGPCRTKEVIGYLDALAEEAERKGEKKPVVVVLDNAPFHTAGAVREGEPWLEEEKGLAP